MFQWLCFPFLSDNHHNPHNHQFLCWMKTEKILGTKKIKKNADTLVWSAQQSETKRQIRKAQTQADRPASDSICEKHGRNCYSCIGLSSHVQHAQSPSRYLAFFFHKTRQECESVGPILQVRFHFNHWHPCQRLVYSFCKLESLI